MLMFAVLLLCVYSFGNHINTYNDSLSQAFLADFGLTYKDNDKELNHAFLADFGLTRLIPNDPAKESINLLFRAFNVQEPIKVSENNLETISKLQTETNGAGNVEGFEDQSNNDQANNLAAVTSQRRASQDSDPLTEANSNETSSISSADVKKEEDQSTNNNDCNSTPQPHDASQDNNPGTVPHRDDTMSNSSSTSTIYDCIKNLFNNADSNSKDDESANNSDGLTKSDNEDFLSSFADQNSADTVLNFDQFNDNNEEIKKIFNSNEDDSGDFLEDDTYGIVRSKNDIHGDDMGSKKVSTYFGYIEEEFVSDISDASTPKNNENNLSESSTQPHNSIESNLSSKDDISKNLFNKSSTREKHESTNSAEGSTKSDSDSLSNHSSNPDLDDSDNNVPEDYVNGEDRNSNSLSNFQNKSQRGQFNKDQGNFLNEISNNIDSEVLTFQFIYNLIEELELYNKRYNVSICFHAKNLFLKSIENFLNQEIDKLEIALKNKQQFSIYQIKDLQILIMILINNKQNLSCLPNFICKLLLIEFWANKFSENSSLTDFYICKDNYYWLSSKHLSVDNFKCEFFDEDNKKIQINELVENYFSHSSSLKLKNEVLINISKVEEIIDVNSADNLDYDDCYKETEITDLRINIQELSAYTDSAKLITFLFEKVNLKKY